jgi:hypothetical protein
MACAGLLGQGLAMPLHLSRVAFACESIDDIARARDRFAVTLPDGRRAARLTSRRSPRRAAELAGGSLYWIIRHGFVARQPILGIGPLPGSEGAEILLEVALVPVVPRHRRSHQGWRYLAPEDAPPDLDAAPDGAPADLLRALADLGLG